jgi:hypothetical protein
MEPGQPRLPCRLRRRRARLGKITGAKGQALTAGKLGSFTVGADNTIVLGLPLRFSVSSIGQFKERCLCQ